MKVSVLIGSRNRPDALRRCLTSILNQDYADLQILVLDDNSDQMRLDEIVRAEFQDPRLCCFRVEQSLGVAGGRNYLMEQADGDVFCVIDDDACFAQPDAVTRIVEALTAKPRIGILAFKVINHYKGKIDLRLPFNRRQRRKNPQLMVKPRLVSYFVGTGHAIRRQVIDQCESYRSDLMYGEEELDLSYQAIEAGFEIYYLPEVVVCHYPQPSVVKSSEKSRHQELYFHTRNRFFIAYKYLPAKYLPIYLAIRLAKHGLEAMKTQVLGQFFGGILAGLKMLPHIERTPLSSRTVAYLEANYGRLWY